MLVLALGAAARAASATIRKGMLPNDPGPAFLPMIAGGGLVCMSLYLFCVREPHEGVPRGADLFRLLSTIALVAVYLNLIEPLGFPAATALFLAAEMWVIGVRSLLALTVTPVALSAVIYATFRFGLDVPLPSTRIWGFLI